MKRVVIRGGSGGQQVKDVDKWCALSCHCANLRLVAAVCYCRHVASPRHGAVVFTCGQQPAGAPVYFVCKAVGWHILARHLQHPGRVLEASQSDPGRVCGGRYARVEVVGWSPACTDAVAATTQGVP